MSPACLGDQFNWICQISAGTTLRKTSLIAITEMFNRQFLIFIFGGLVCAIIDISLMHLMILAGFNYIIAATGGFFTGLGASYLFHSQLTFRFAMSSTNFWRFLAVVGVNYLFTIAFVSLFFLIFKSALIGKIISLPIIAVNGYYLSRRWVFQA